MRSPVRIIPLLLLSMVGSVWAAQADRVNGTIDRNQAVVLKGTVHPSAQPQHDLGPVDPSTRLTYVSLLVQPSADQQTALKQLLAEQQDPTSPNYQRWLTPEQFGERFGLSHPDLNKITRWLRSEGFSIAEVARGRDWIAINGTAGQIQSAFHTQIHRFDVDGEERYANSTEPSVPKALDGIVVGFRGLNNFRIKPMIVKKSAATPDYTVGPGTYFLAPDDIATIYDIGPLYTAGINGTGMKIAVMGQTDIHITDIQQFRAGFNLPKNDPLDTLAGGGCVDPGFTGDEPEADLDLEWSGAVARDAKIIFVKCDAAHSGVIGSLTDAINRNTAPVLSMSYGQCEAVIGSNYLTQTYEPMIAQANAQGQTLMVSSGDSGAATCDKSSENQATLGLAVNGLASPPEVTAVGGTEFNEGSGTYWNPTNGANGGSAISYIPELAWDDSSAGTGLNGGGLASTGGGASIFFLRPSFQTGPGKFDSKFRSVPDVAMSASADHDGYIVCTGGSCAGGIQNGSVFGGTSVSCPVFAGIVALLNQSLKNTPPAGLGNINLHLYPLAQSVPLAFHDVPAGNYNITGANPNPSGNMVPCQSGSPNCPAKLQFGFLTGTGYDEVTGLGSVDADVFVTNWAVSGNMPTSTALTLSPASVNVGATGPVMAKATVTHVTGTGTPTGTVKFYVDGSTTPAGSGTLKSGSYTFSYSPSALALGNHSMTATYAGDFTFAGSTSAGETLAVQDFRIALPTNPTTITVSAPGQSGTTTLTITPLNGFHQTLGYSCSGLPSEATCTFTAASATSETLTIATTAPSASLDKGSLGRSGIFYALLLPSLLGLVVSVGNRKRTLRGGRLLGLIAALAVSTLCMPACGGGSSSTTQSNPGTPTGNSTVTVMAAAGSLSHSVQITLAVK
jgi:subtilase family serine protease